MNTAIDHMERMLSRTIGEHLDLATDPGDDLERVKADLSQIELVIMNLVINAKDAMPQGGRLTLRTRNVTVDETNTKSGAGSEAWEVRLPLRRGHGYRHG